MLVKLYLPLMLHHCKHSVEINFATGFLILSICDNIALTIHPVWPKEVCLVFGTQKSQTFFFYLAISLTLNSTLTCLLTYIVYTSAKNYRTIELSERNIIPNDTKLFAQADCEKAVEFYLSSDTESYKIYNLLRSETTLKFQFIDLNTPYNETFGLLEF